MSIIVLRDDNINDTFERVRAEYGCVVKSSEVLIILMPC
jgi:hypothetical protein